MRSHTFFLLTLSVLLASSAAAKSAGSVTVYVSEDQVFSEPLLKRFEKTTGITVRALYDTEESKSTGVMNRLLAEQRHPRADVYWANEPVRAEVLRTKGLLAPYRSPSAEGIDPEFVDPQYHWTGFSARYRLFIVYTKAKSTPQSMLDYTQKTYAHKGVIANPLFGTTTAHIAALFSVLGNQKGEAFLSALKANGTAISTSNGESADFVASGMHDFALVDSDDAMSRMQRGASVKIVYPDQGKEGIGLFVVPNTVMLIKGAPHPANGKKLIDFLLSAESEKALAHAACAQIPLHDGVEAPAHLKPIGALKIMPVDYAEVARRLLQIQPYLSRWVFE